MSGSVEMKDLQEDIAREIYGAAEALGIEWKTATVKYETVGGYGAPYFAVDEMVNPDPFPFDAISKLRQLRVLMARGGDTPWFTAEVNLEASGEFRFIFNYEDSPAWGNGVQPSAGEYQRDLQDYPQLKSDAPSWFPANLN